MKLFACDYFKVSSSSIRRRKKGSTQEREESRRRNKINNRDKVRPIRNKRWARDRVMDLDTEDANTESKTSLSFPTQRGGQG